MTYALETETNVNAKYLIDEIERLEKRVKADREGLNDRNFEISQGSRVFLKTHLRQLVIHKLALKGLNA